MSSLKINFDTQAMMEQLEKCTCSELRSFIRVMSLKTKGVSKINKSELIRAILIQMRKHVVQKWISTKLDTVVQDFESAFPNRRELLNQAGYIRRAAEATPEQKLLYRIFLYEKVMREVHQKIYDKRAPMCKASGFEPAEWGASVDGDCKPGYAYLDNSACCVNMSQIISVWDVDQLGRCNDCDDKKNCKHCENFSPSDREYLKNLVQAAEQSAAELSAEKFKSTKEANLTLGFVAEFQKSLINHLGREFDAIMALANPDEDDMCDLTPEQIEEAQETLLTQVAEASMGVLSGVKGAVKASMAKGANALSSIAGWATNGMVVLAKFLFWILKFFMRIAGGILKAAWWGAKMVVKVGYDITMNLTSAGRKLAWFLVSNPAQARVILTVAKGVKKAMCRYVGHRLADSTVFQAIEAQLCLKDEECSKKPTENAQRLLVAKGMQAKAFDMAVKAVEDSETARTAKNLVARGNELADKIFESARVQSASLTDFLADQHIGLIGVVRDTWTPSILYDFIASTRKATLAYRDAVFGMQAPSSSVAVKGIVDTAQVTVLPPIMQVEVEHITKEEPAVGLFASLASGFTAVKTQVADYAQTAIDAGIPERFVEKFTTSDSLKKVAKNGGRLIGSGVGGLLKGIPVVGAAGAAIFETVGEIMGEATADAVAEAVRITVYKKDLIASLQLFVEFLDVDDCLAEMDAIRIKCPLIHRQIVLAKAVGSAWITARIGGGSVEEIRDMIHESIKPEA